MSDSFPIDFKADPIRAGLYEFIDRFKRIESQLSSIPKTTINPDVTATKVSVLENRCSELEADLMQWRQRSLDLMKKVSILENKRWWHFT